MTALNFESKDQGNSQDQWQEKGQENGGYGGSEKAADEPKQFKQEPLEVVLLPPKKPPKEKFDDKTWVGWTKLLVLPVLGIVIGVAQWGFTSIRQDFENKTKARETREGVLTAFSTEVGKLQEKDDKNLQKQHDISTVSTEIRAQAFIALRRLNQSDDSDLKGLLIRYLYESRLLRDIEYPLEARDGSKTTLFLIEGFYSISLLPAAHNALSAVSDWEPAR